MKKIIFTLIAIFCLAKNSYSTVIDPSNLAQNIMQVIQQKIESKLSGDQKEIANSQLKTESQTTADVIGTNSTVKTNLNLDMAEFNYENSPSTLYKSYYQNLNVRGKNYKLLLYLGRVKVFYQNNILSILSPVRNDAYIKRFNALSEAIQEADLLFADFTNTVDNNGGTDNSIDNTNGSHDSSTPISSGLGNSTNTKALQKEFNQKIGAINQKITAIEKAKANVDELDIPDAAKNDMLNYLNWQQSTLNDQIDDLSSSFQESIFGSVSNTLGLDGAFGGIFGSNSSEKGKGQEIKIKAPMGRLSDAQRIDFATKAFKNLDVVDYQIALLEQELIAIKSQYDLKKYVDESKFSTAGFYMNSGAMDNTKMMNFDKE
ncbi:hypothetical protein VB796_22910 [Arcicella sp. LKC2W]|uniref:hypothetical protein n=1 Tax=Arcicella sp. LKC2W TaxID=2984198 RepID=UPI002B20F187|nr:hypothetical protein [Arcicella sp. LKC2W]MEA5461939.1 hypothetical protein [Arcicella sp. LKC2W]